MNVPTTLPFFNGTHKQATRRDGSPVPIFSPRTHLPPFQIIKPATIALTGPTEIALVDCDGIETDIHSFFDTSDELITGGYTNGFGTLRSKT